jgi:Domain of unknown function (DUF4268)
MISLSKLVEIDDVREIWKHEAYDFTQWLVKEENIEILNDVIGLTLLNPEAEVNVGKFNVDIKAETDDGKVVIIENQLEQTDHKHLGQIITYASGLKASYIIWVVKNAHEEHREAIDWLNENTNDEIGFFLIEIKAYRIDNSLPAPKFEIISKPNNWQKTIKNLVNGELPKGKLKNIEFWESFYTFAGEKFSNRPPSKNHFVGLTIGKPGAYLFLNSTSRNKKASISLELEHELYDNLILKREILDGELDLPFTWFKTEKKGFITYYYDYSIRDEEKWEEVFKFFIKTIASFKSVAFKYL